MSKSKKIIICILILIGLILILRRTYSKYVEVAYVQKISDVAMWNIKVNDVDITGDTKEFVIEDFAWEEEPHVKTPKVAPGMKGKFKLKVDTTGTQVALKYKISIDATELTQIADVKFEITDYKINGEKKEFAIEENENSDEEVNTDTDENPDGDVGSDTDEETDPDADADTEGNASKNKNKIIEVTKALADVNTVDNLEINVEWVNLDTDEANRKDSLLGSEANTKLKLPIIFTVEQIINPDFIENDPAKDF